MGGVQLYRLSVVTSHSGSETSTETELLKVLIMDDGVSIACKNMFRHFFLCITSIFNVPVASSICSYMA